MDESEVEADSEVAALEVLAFAEPASSSSSQTTFRLSFRTLILRREKEKKTKSLKRSTRLIHFLVAVS
jgi:hypothetical protein